MQLAKEWGEVFRACRGGFIAAGIFSMGVNILYLAPVIYMMQVYDRVLSSGSIPTLLFLTFAVLFGLAVLAMLDDIRSRILVRLSIRIDRMMAERIFSGHVTHLQQYPTANRGQMIRDMDTVRQFLTANGIHAFLDAPWAPTYLFVIYILSPVMGTVALLGMLGVVVLTLANEKAVASRLKQAGDYASINYAFTDATLRNVDVIQGMGMLKSILVRWQRQRTDMLANQVSASDRGGVFSSITRWYRMSLQSVILGVGAYIVVDHQTTVGVMYAGVLLMGRAIAPVEQMMGVWKQFVNARGAFNRLNQLLLASPVQPTAMELPRPEGRVDVNGVIFSPPGTRMESSLFRNLTFSLPAGEVLGVIGPSGSGKSSLARLLVGVWKPVSGSVRLDGADVFTWERSSFGRYVGYLPQDIELFSGTVRDNIARFTDASAEDVVDAAKKAGIHELILQLPKGYETDIGDGGAFLSGGQRQRIGIARAIFGNPVFLVLDEPNSNLDSLGEEALQTCLTQAKAAGTTVIIISHRVGILGLTDKLMLLRNGNIELFGPRNSVLAAMSGKPQAVAPAPQLQQVAG